MSGGVFIGAVVVVVAQVLGRVAQDWAVAAQLSRGVAQVRTITAQLSS